MPLFSGSRSGGAAPTDFNTIAQQQDAEVQAARLAPLQFQQAQMKVQADADEAATRRRSMAVSLLAGALTEPDADKRQALYGTLAPLAMRHDPTLQLDPARLDDSTVRALQYSTLSPKEQLADQLGEERTAALGNNPIPVYDPAAGKPLPASTAKGLLENRQNLTKAENALALLNGETVALGGETIAGDKDATGWKGYLPQSLLNRVDPTGVATRAAIADIGSMTIHDRSGAAVSAFEFPRLAPFVPAATDDAETAKKKLRNFVATYRQLVDDGEIFYAESGYKVPGPSGATGSWGGTTPRGRIVNFNDLPE